MSSERTPRVAVIGAGMSGICMAVKLQDAGIDDFVVYESADDVGGTWRDNTYPGLSCDVPSRFYSYSFRLNPGWSRFMSPGPEIHRYFRRSPTSEASHRAFGSAPKSRQPDLTTSGGGSARPMVRRPSMC